MRVPGNCQRTDTCCGTSQDAPANLVGSRLPWLIGIVVTMVMLLLVVMFSSVTIAVKAAAMNLLSISAAYGVLVAVTQHGIGRQLLRFPETMPATTWVPMFDAAASRRVASWAARHRAVSPRPSLGSMFRSTS
jgi:uncharacterized membrane protein YdfJ with MMPL/SSD domain